ncbi:ER degradation-enhancing alpha-mannosidase-like protein 2 [Clonorchis sinensis]|uniref:alpha-1,2-Mannosidase n=1 Tax=Clonorchis sinensis TaxID=79923 RepID=A0A8T1MN01_CLOSI|nr:ER degradation-enhancing alpha-mannosidase-like protein 2 [Clonorchis sinensis]
MRYAYPLDELRPLTCDGHNTWGSFSLTLVDALDTLAIMGNWSEFRRAGQMLLDHLDTSRNVNVSVFETNIRVIGGLLSAHLLSRRAGFRVEPSWPCSGPLLRQAEVLGNKLLPAFDTPTGMPYGTVNLAINGVPPKETPVTCVAGIGTMTTNRVKELFYHAYDGYMRYAYPLDELRPLTCDGHNTWGSFSLTLVDALDTLAIMGNWSEFRRAGQMLLDHLDTSRNVNVSVFETNIRVIGGLLSAHLLSRRAGFRVEPSWPCSGPLLRQAEVLGNKLLPAFDTPTGMPYGTVNLAINGVPPKETPVTCVAGIGTLILEFGTLSRLTGDPRFEKVAMNALRSIWKYRDQDERLAKEEPLL